MSENVNPIDALLGLIDSRLLDVNTCLPGEIVSYSNGLASVIPTGKKRFADGDVLDYPIIQNVRVCWPSFSNGQAGIKGPVKTGDKCLIVFSQQATDGTNDRRMFDLSDAYCMMFDLGNTNADSSNNSDLTMYFGSAYIRITEGGAININSPGGVTINGSVTQLGGDMSSNGVFVDSHTHSGVIPGGGSTGGPN